jgi:hypothetical protein
LLLIGRSDDESDLFFFRRHQRFQAVVTAYSSTVEKHRFWCALMIFALSYISGRSGHAPSRIACQNHFTG